VKTDSVRADSVHDPDFPIHKNLSIRESVTLQMRAWIVNLTNLIRQTWRGNPTVLQRRDEPSAQREETGIAVFRALRVLTYC